MAKYSELCNDIDERCNAVKEAWDNSVVDLQGIPYAIKMEEGLATHYDAVGQIRYYEQVIAVEPSLQAFEFFSTMLHEFIEFINKKLELDLEHNQIQALETALFQILVDNPWYMRSILETLYGDKIVNPKAKPKERVKVSKTSRPIALEKIVPRAGRKEVRPVWDY